MSFSVSEKVNRMPEDRAIKVEDVIFDVADIDMEDASFKAIRDELKSSELLHPITVQVRVDGFFNLIAGRKRLAAYRQLGKPIIKALVFEPYLNETDIRKIALVENLKRYNLPWYEEVVREKELNDLRVAEHGVRKSGQRSHIGWSPTDTARELNKSVGKVYEDLLLADALKSNPHLSKIKDRDTAMRIVRSTAKREMAAVEALLPPTFEMNQVFCGDSFEILKELPANTFDVCITDPPWSEFREEALTADVSTIKPIIKELFRVMKPESFTYWICSSVDHPAYLALFKEVGFNVQKFPLIWKKGHVLTHGTKPWEYWRDYEPILLAVRGNPSRAGQERSAVFSFDAVHHSKSIHPNEKPVGLIEQILKDCSHVGSRVIDPFGGSGVTAEACINLDRHYIIIEKDHKFYEGIQRRINGLRSDNNTPRPTEV